MGRIVKRELATGKTRWIAKWRDGAADRSASFATRGEAEAKLNEVGHTRRTGTYVSPDKARVTLHEWAWRWLDGQTWEGSTIRQWEAELSKWICGPRDRPNHLGSRTLVSLDRLDIEAFRKRLLAAGLKQSTARSIYRKLPQVLRAAVPEYIARNPADPVESPKVPAGGIEEVMTEAEVEAIVAALGEPYATMVRVLAGTGLRYGELAGLRMEHVVWLPWPKLIVRTQLAASRHDGDERRLRRVKNPGRGEREVDLSAPTAACLSAHLAEYGPSPDGFLFHVPAERSRRAEGRRSPVTNNTFNRHWRRATARAGITRHVTPHDLRHFHASCLLRWWGPQEIADIAKRLGHSVEICMKTYLGLIPTEEEARRRRVDALAL